MNYEERYIKNQLPKRSSNANKGTFGHVLNIAGSTFYPGAAYLSSISALKVGCGRVTLASTQSTLQAVSALSPDIILKPLFHTRNGCIHSKSHKILRRVINEYQVLSIGCGLSLEKQTKKFFDLTIKELKKTNIPLVIDADGLNLLAQISNEKFKHKPKGLADYLPANTILTPHPKELARFFGVEAENVLDNQEFFALKCSEKFNCTTVLKTHKTVVADNSGNMYVNNISTSTLSKGGSGDVLCGMITGFLAQGMKIFEACALAVYVHSLAGKIAGEDVGEYSMLSSELINFIHRAIKTLP